MSHPTKYGATYTPTTGAYVDVELGTGNKQQSRDAAFHAKVSAIQGQIDETRGQMLDNIDGVLARGQKLEDLTKKTEDLQVHAKGFKDRAIALKRFMCTRNCKIMAGIAGAVLLLILIIVLATHPWTH